MIVWLFEHPWLYLLFGLFVGFPVFVFIERDTRRNNYQRDEDPNSWSVFMGMLVWAFATVLWLPLLVATVMGFAAWIVFELMVKGYAHLYRKFTVKDGRKP